MDIINRIGQTYYIENDFTLRKIIPSQVSDPHTHEFMEFVYILGGKCLHTVNGVEYPMDSGDLLIINYGEVHAYTAEASAQFYNILIKPTILDKSLEACRDLFFLFELPPFRSFKPLINDNCRFIRFSPEEKNCFEYMLLLLEKELRCKDVGYELTTQAGVNFLLTMIFRKMRGSLLEQTHEFKQVLNYIEENYAQTLSEAGLAHMCHYNPAYFSRIFKKYTGLTFTEYVTRLRISKACECIAGGDRAGNVYIRVGYTNKTTFYKHFRQVTGMTPLEYKKVKK